MSNYTNSRIRDFAREINGKRVAVIGIAVSNTPLIEFLYKHGAQVTAFDRAGADALADRIERLRPCNIEYRLGPGYLDRLKGFDRIYRTPVIRPDIPEFVMEQGRGAVISSEMELFLDLCPATVFGVTGSDGKTTTTTLIYEMLKAGGYNCYLGGNIGRPLISDVEAMSPDDMAVVELSSFQLMTMKKSVDIAVITNISPNHLDVHKSYGEYMDAKKNIFMHQGQDGVCVLNYDNKETRSLCAGAPGRLVLFSVECCGDFGEDINNAADANHIADTNHGAIGAVYAMGDDIIYNKRDAEHGTMHGVAHGATRNMMRGMEHGSGPSAGYNTAHGTEPGEPGAAKVTSISDIRIPGRHNVENYLAAIGAVYPYVGADAILATARSFNGVEHRQEYFRTLDGARYFNDSIASSPTRTIACLNTFDQKIILIAGGKDKDLDYAPLGRHIAEKAKLLILCGQTAPLIKESLLRHCETQGVPCPVPIVECDSYEEAVAAARKNAVTGDIVVLSPASTSFDRFRNFEERGRVFKALVNALK
ncbi:MAG: Mur ligase family protein [Oscillospiraceae bacterium]|nr:Mur ligase family protein [Oscillospiraceae bacterium]